MRLLLVLALVAVATCAPGQVRYDGYEVLRIVPRSEGQKEWLEHFEKSFVSKLDFWKTSHSLNQPMDVMVPPRYQAELREVLENRGIGFTVHIEDVQELIDESMTSSAGISAIGGFDYNSYHTYEELMQWVTDFVSEYSSIAEEIVVTQSVEGRDIKAIKLGSKGWGKPGAFMQGGIHAREWISPATMVNMAKKLAESYGTDPDVTAMLDSFDWYIVPCLNVDGYSYSWTNDRMWRKNRQVTSKKRCRGVDLNRNYDYQWGGRGASSSECDETYRGPSAMSEPELSGLTNWLLGLKAAGKPFHLHMDVHAYGQYWLYPWGYSALIPLPAEADDMDTVAKAATSSLASLYGTSYLVGGSAKAMYAASGASEDWGFGTLGAKYTYVVELRDEGRYGFLLPESQIQATAEETFEAIKELCRSMVAEYA
ncbi:carboxypeptidase B-like [Patiria miniata]|uniref:Peptidase M14 domain-containing protein n=1 Tax=Patiria miniata TaxID=46514 RepID=A0A914BDZ6_PATMI|nr:carboxypeptidase B-like [Patiria miniata]